MPTVCEGFLKMVDGPLHIIFFTVYVTKDTVIMAGENWFIFAQGEVGCLGCSSPCSHKLLIFIQHPSQPLKGCCLSHNITKLFPDSQCFFCPFYCFLMVAQ